jgi:hypothetical protein
MTGAAQTHPLQIPRMLFPREVFLVGVLSGRSCTVAGSAWHPLERTRCRIQRLLSMSLATVNRSHCFDRRSKLS